MNNYQFKVPFYIVGCLGSMIDSHCGQNSINLYCDVVSSLGLRGKLSTMLNYTYSPFNGLYGKVTTLLNGL